MKKTKKLSVLVFLGLTIGNTEASMAASSATAEATIDWSSFSVVGYALGSESSPGFSWSNQFSSITAMTLPANGSASATAADWSASLNNTTGNTSSWALASTDAATSQTSTQVTLPSSNDNAWAYSYRSGSLSVTGNGLLVFSVDYTLDAALLSDNGLTSNDYVSTGVAFDVSKTGPSVNSQSFSANDSIYLSSWNIDNSPAHQTGRLNLALVVNNGDQFDFIASNYAGAALDSAANAPISSVPLPGAAWLFLCSLIGFLGLHRRKSTLIA